MRAVLWGSTSKPREGGRAVLETQHSRQGRVRGIGPLRNVWSLCGRRRRRHLVAAAGLVAAISVGGTLAATAGTISYSVAWGDTLSEIAESNGTDVDALAELNGIDDPDLIIEGQELLIPVDDSSTGAHSYLIQPGDTLSGIAERFGVTVEALVAWNNIADPDLIVMGDSLAVPAAGDATTDQSNPSSDEGSGQGGAVETPPEEPATETVVEAGSTVDGPRASQLHLVKADETLDSIAVQYDVTVGQLMAANALSSASVEPGAILKIPPAELNGVQLVGMPADAETWPLVSALAGTSLATTYWGEPVAVEDLLAMIPTSSNPHVGFRGNPHGMWGQTADYGVYNEPIAAALTELGFTADAFYADGDRSLLTDYLDAGTPVIVWVTYQLQPQERQYVEDESGAYSLIPEQHALAVYGYDDAGIYAVDVSDGSYSHYAWEPFMESWSLFDGMSLAISIG